MLISIFEMESSNYVLWESIDVTPIYMNGEGFCINVERSEWIGNDLYEWGMAVVYVLGLNKDLSPFGDLLYRILLQKAG